MTIFCHFWPIAGGESFLSIFWISQEPENIFSKQVILPISPDQKPLYPANWREISQRIRFDRAGGRCERCQAPHLWYRAGNELIHPLCIELAMAILEIEGRLDDVKITRIVLTTAHLNHNPADSSDDNLAALCQRCHLAHDRLHHITTIRKKREAAAKQGRLFAR
ncbi:MAG: hypothetical protein BWY07_01999 [Candidatus Hydrogenedentes bacterium ADurb.Bin170]|nr:MAG: hypothetical protein BWY07_01999 [Candidatus Hydrogenedentes bacterium ADurb.Bin170]